MAVPSAAPVASAPSEDQNAARGLTFVVLAMALLPAQDAVAKYLSDSLSPGQISWARYLFQVLLTLPFLIYFQGVRGLIPNRFWPNVARGALVAIASVLYFLALKFMPIADALAIAFIQPFILTILSAVIDKEQVGWRRRIAVTTGFLGVLIVVQPSWNVLGPVSLVPMGAGLAFAFYILLNRRMSRYDTPLAMQFTSGLAALVLLTVALGVGERFSVPELLSSTMDGGQLGLLLVMAVFGTTGHLLLVFGGRLAPSSLVAPLQYVEIVFAVLLGYFVFGDFPSAVKWLGIVIIVGSGAYVFWREGRRR